METVKKAAHLDGRLSAEVKKDVFLVGCFRNMSDSHSVDNVKEAY